MSYLIPTLIVLVILAVLLGLMWWGWRARARRDAGYAAYAVPDERQAALATAPVNYVATTRHEAPLERLALPGLRYRARAAITVGPDGVLLEIPGNPTTWIPATAVRGAGPASYAIDRAVEQGGLICLDWQLPASDERADSYLRVVDTADRDAVLGALQHLSAPTPTESDF